MTNNLPRRTLEEVVARYELEPELRDIYVEGKTDKVFVEWFLEQNGKQDFTVYEIDTIEIPTETLFDRQLSDNKRSRVIALALDLQSRLSKLPPHLTCIADKDFDWLFGRDYESDLLLFTDYTSLEMYLFNEMVIDKFLRLCVKVSEIKAQDCICTLGKVLEELFLIRATNENLKLNMSWPQKIGESCQLKNNTLLFKPQQFIDKYLNMNNQKNNQQIFMSKLEELRATQVRDVRCKVRGHDFMELLCLYIRPSLKKEIRNSYSSEILAGALLGCIEVNQLLQEKLFQHLLERIG